MSFAQYQNAQTVATKYDARLGVHPDFLQFVGDTTTYDEPFYNDRFHVVWGNFGESSYGPGDYMMFRFTPGALECVSVHKPTTRFTLGQLERGENTTFSGDVTWTFRPTGHLMGDQPVFWITGRMAGRVVNNYSVVPITF
jgi:hypothetical protein